MDQGEVEDYLAGLVVFFEKLPAAVVTYSVAIGALSLAAILVRVAVNVFTGV